LYATWGDFRGWSEIKDAFKIGTELQIISYVHFPELHAALGKNPYAFSPFISFNLYFSLSLFFSLSDSLPVY
jgi:hypothetical protein